GAVGGGPPPRQPVGPVPRTPRGRQPVARAGPLDPLLRGRRPLLLQPRHAEHDPRRRDAEGDAVAADGGIPHAAAPTEPRRLASCGVGAPRAQPGAPRDRLIAPSPPPRRSPGRGRPLPSGAEGGPTLPAPPRRARAFLA